MDNNHVTELMIDISALKYNYRYLKGKTEKNTKVLAVVKSSDYGLDDIMISKILEREGVDYFGVAYLDEAIVLKKNKIKTPILIFHPQVKNYELIVEYGIQPTIYSLYTLEKFIDFAKKKKMISYPVHLKFNSGLNRLGFNSDEVDDLLRMVKDEKRIEIISIFSHIAAGEDLEQTTFTKKQIQKFDDFLKEFRSKFRINPLIHIANTASVFNYPESQLDMIRIGIGLYGFGSDSLKNVIVLKSIISQIRLLQRGDYVGYNMKFFAEKEEKIAIIPIGYADGFSMYLGCGRGCVTIHGKKARTVGNVCMDMVFVNVTNIDCKEGDEVIIFDSQEAVQEIATTCGTISHEILTSISNRVKRKILD